MTTNDYVQQFKDDIRITIQNAIRQLNVNTKLEPKSITIQANSIDISVHGTQSFGISSCYQIRIEVKI